MIHIDLTENKIHSLVCPIRWFAQDKKAYGIYNKVCDWLWHLYKISQSLMTTLYKTDMRVKKNIKSMGKI